MSSGLVLNYRECDELLLTALSSGLVLNYRECDELLLTALSSGLVLNYRKCDELLLTALNYLIWTGIYDNIGLLSLYEVKHNGVICDYNNYYNIYFIYFKSTTITKALQ